MNLSVCLEPGSCDINVEILNEMYLPKIGCDWNVDFSGKQKLNVLLISLEVKMGKNLNLCFAFQSYKILINLNLSIVFKILLCSN